MKTSDFQIEKKKIQAERKRDFRKTEKSRKKQKGSLLINEEVIRA